MHRPTFRQRPIDNAKPLQLIKNIKDVMSKTDDLAEREELKNIESEIKRVLQLYDERKRIITPGSGKIEKTTTATKNDKKIPNNFASEFEYSQKEFKRPDHYIIYSEKTRKENHKRDYEATRHDVTYLNCEKNFMTLEEFEKVISTLENDIGTGEPIPHERAKAIITNLYPDKAQHADGIAKVYKKFNFHSFSLLEEKILKNLF